MRKNLPWWGYFLMLPLAVPALYIGGWVIDGVLDLPVQAEEARPAETLTGTGHTLSVTTIESEYYTFEPRPDITAFEVAQALDLVVKALACRGRFDDCGFKASLEGLPPETKRHFVKH